MACGWWPVDLRNGRHGDFVYVVVPVDAASGLRELVISAAGIPQRTEERIDRFHQNCHNGENLPCMVGGGLCGFSMWQASS